MTYYYNQRNYSNIKYPSKNHPNATISSSGCGVCSVAICINTLAQKELYTISSLTKLALNSGAREAEGTNVSTLLKAINKEHSEFTFSTTNYESVLYNHLKNGGLAIANQGDAYNVFSSQGHFVACVGIENNYIKVYDVYMYDGKYSQSPRNKRIIKPLNYGCVVSLTEIDKACGDRNPSYYLISMKEAPKKQKPIYNKDSKYKLTAYVNVWNLPSTYTGSIKKVKDLTADGKKHASSTNAIANATLVTGTIVTCQGVTTDQNGNIWLKIPSGYIPVYYNGVKRANWYNG